MNRYRVLRNMGCDPFSSGVVAFLNWLRGNPPNRITFLTTEIEI